MSSITILQAQAPELDEAALLFDRYRTFQGRASDLPAARAFLQSRFDRGDSTVLLAQDGHVAIGFAQLYPSYSSVSLARVFVLNDLFVEESFRRRGTAAELLAAAEAYAWSRGAVESR